MNRVVLCLVSFVVLATSQAQQSAAGKQETTAPNALQPVDRYDNRNMTLLKAGKAVPTHVTIRDWQIHGRQKIEKFPEAGILIVQLQSGRVTTTIRGVQEKREPGDYWNVADGTSMGVQVTSESAILHIVALGKP